MPPTSVAILGAGPAACTLAALLSQQGVPSVVFDDGKRPEMLVGESLIPAVVPLLRRLGIEDRTAAISQHKPGVSFLHSLLQLIPVFSLTSAAGNAAASTTNNPHPPETPPPSPGSPAMTAGPSRRSDTRSD
jgi:Tryptophan halogenase